MKVEKILYATDYSRASREALRFATALARDTNALLLIVHVSDHEPSPIGELMAEPPTPDASETDRLNAVLPPDPNVRYEHRLLHGEPGSTEVVQPAAEIVKLAQSEGVDLIVLGTHGRSGLSRLLMGSVAESVVRDTPCPVLTVKQPAVKHERKLANA